MSMQNIKSNLTSKNTDGFVPERLKNFGIHV
jgi:hypothetical protein